MIFFTFVFPFSELLSSSLSILNFYFLSLFSLYLNFYPEARWRWYSGLCPHPSWTFILLTFVNPKLLSYISFPFIVFLIHPELLSFVSLFFLHLNFYHLPHPSWNSSFSWICVHAFSTSIFFSLFLILNLSKFTFTFSLSLSKTLKTLVQVTEENKEEYLGLVTEWRMTR